MAIVTSAQEIPAARYYVLCNDSFMSGWGKAEGRVNTLILPCETWDEAQVVVKNARARLEMKRCRIVTGKPRLQAHVVYSLHDRGDYSRWYTPGAFGKG